MCDYKSKYDPDYECSHPDYGPGKDEEKTFCIFHSDRKDKDVEEFYIGFKKLYESGKHDFRGFIFTKGFSFEKLKKETGALIFKEANFMGAIFSKIVFLRGVTFSGGANFMRATFSKRANFSKVTFSGGAYFRDAKFSGEACFRGANFMGDTLFRGVKFTGEADLERAIFSGVAHFGGATFSGVVNLWGAIFSEETYFGEATFSGETSFGMVKFSREAYFRGANFTGNAVFEGAKFTEEADFNRAIFLGMADFGGVKFTGEVEFVMAKFTGEANFRGSILSGESGFNGAKFLGIADFRDATFSGLVVFSGATFSGEAYLIRSRFTGEAYFIGTTFSGIANFWRAIFLEKAFFEDTVFSVEANFRWATFSEMAYFLGAKFSENCKVTFSGKTFENSTIAIFQELNIEKDAELNFEGVNLNQARFLGTDLSKINFTKVYWTGRKYDSSSYFGRIRVYDEDFQYRGRFLRKFEDGESNEDNIFKAFFRKIGIKIVAKLNTSKPKEKEDNHYAVHLLYNQLIKNYERTNRYHEAGDFFVGAMEMRRIGRFEKRTIRWLLGIYKWISLYGERPIRALGWLVALFLSYGFIYSLFDLVVIGGKLDTSVKSKFVKGLMISLSNLTLGRTSPIFEVTNPIIGNILQGTEIIAGATLLSLFILAMNRKFRRMKD